LRRRNLKSVIFAAILGRDGRRDARARDEGLADLDALSSDEENVAEGHGRAGIARDLLHAELLAFGHSVLLPARLDHSVHGSSSSKGARTIPKPSR